MPSSTIHAGYAATASRLINKHGRAMSVLKLETIGDAWNPTQVEREIAIVGVQTNYKMAEIDGTIVQAGDRRFLVGSESILTTDMRLRDAMPTSSLKALGQWSVAEDEYGVTAEELTLVDYSIISMETVQPGMSVVLYKIQARR